MRLRTLVCVLAYALVLGSSCKQILSIDDAQIDPTLVSPRDGGAGVGGTAGSGSGGTSGSASDGQAGRSEAGIDLDAGTLCERYCNTVMTYCQGAYEVYSDRDVCMAACNVLPPGNPGDQSGNSVNCRIFAAQTANSIEPEFYCPAAGPGGNGKCGDDCDGFCTLVEAACTGDLPHYATDLDCQTACRKLPNYPSPPTEPSYSTAGLSAKYNGPYIQCRLLHACNSLLDDIHCTHAMGESTCTAFDAGQ